MKEQLLLVGSGKHAKSVADVILSENKYSIAGCVSFNVGEYLGVGEIKTIYNDEQLDSDKCKSYKNVFIAIGDNGIRKKLYDKCVNIGYNVVSVISPYSIVSPYAKIGNGTCIMHGAIIHVNSIIGDNCIINTKASVDHDCNIGNHCHIAPGVTMSGSVSVKEGVHIGTGASVIDNIEIGKWSYIGGGAVVVKNIDANILAYGVPAKKIKNLYIEVK